MLHHQSTAHDISPGLRMLNVRQFKNSPVVPEHTVEQGAGPSCPSPFSIFMSAAAKQQIASINQ